MLVSLVPYGAGRPTTAVAIFVGGMVLLVAATVLRFRRWPARTLTFEESIDLPHPCATVWDLIEPPEKAPLLDPTCFAGYRVPGTPEGVGAQHALQRVTGVTAVIEVLEYERGRRAKTRTVSPPGLAAQRTVETLDPIDPIDGGCRYTIAQELDIRSGDVALRSWVTQVRARHRDRLDRTREVLASASSVPDVRPTTNAGAPWPPPTPVRWEPPNASVGAARDEGSQQSSRVVPLQESVLLPWSCDHVWEVMTSPEMVPVLDVGFVRTYRIPGTPEGVGEWWAHEIASGATVIYETLEYDRPRRLVVQPVLPVPDSRTVTTLAPAAGGCTYTVSIDKHRDTSSHEDVASDERWRRATRARIAALQRALATPDAGPEQRSAERADVPPPPGRPRLRLDRRLTERDALVLCVLAAAVTVLAWFRQFVLAGLAVLLVVLALLVGPRLARRLRRPRTVTIQESIRLPWSCDEVWALIEPAENEPLLDPTLRVSLRVPGTPRGVGERQAAVTTAGAVVVGEIVEIVPGRRLAAELVSPQVLGRQHVVQTLEPVDGGCVYTVTVEAGVTKGTVPASYLRESLRRRLERTRQVLESSTA